MAAVSSLLSFIVAKFGLSWDVGEIMALVGTVMTPFLIYIGAEGYSEAQAKANIEQSKAQKELADSVLSKIETQIKDNKENVT